MLGGPGPSFGLLGIYPAGAHCLLAHREHPAVLVHWVPGPLSWLCSQRLPSRPAEAWSDWGPALLTLWLLWRFWGRSLRGRTGWDRVGVAETLLASLLASVSLDHQLLETRCTGLSQESLRASPAGPLRTQVSWQPFRTGREARQRGGVSASGISVQAQSATEPLSTDDFSLRPPCKAGLIVCTVKALGVNGARRWWKAPSQVVPEQAWDEGRRQRSWE